MAGTLLLVLLLTFVGNYEALNCFGQQCPEDKLHYCEIFPHDNRGQCYLHHGGGHNHHEDHQLCLGAHHPDDHCFCHEQSCIDQMVLQMTPAPTTQAPATQVPVTAATTAAQRKEVLDCFGKKCYTPDICEITFVKNIPVLGVCGTSTTNMECAHSKPVTGYCYCDSAICMGIVNALTTVATTSVPTTANVPVGSTAAGTTLPPTTVPTTIPTTLHPQACIDDETGNFTCKGYNDQYNMCNSLTSTLQKIAKTRCPKFCNLCGNGTAPTQATLTGSTALPPCEDHDTRCSQAVYKGLLCDPNATPDTKKYAITTCPKTCNYCNEYFETATCHTCGDLNNQIPCSQADIFGNATIKTCASGQQFCMTDIIQDSSGNKDVYKRCVDEPTCQTKWIKESADLDYCSKYGTVTNANAFECHFCCHGDLCNKQILPPSSVLVQKPGSGKEVLLKKLRYQWGIRMSKSERADTKPANINKDKMKKS